MKLQYLLCVGTMFASVASAERRDYVFGKTIECKSHDVSVTVSPKSGNNFQYTVTVGEDVRAAYGYVYTQGDAVITFNKGSLILDPRAGGVLLGELVIDGKSYENLACTVGVPPEPTPVPTAVPTP